MEIGPRIEKPDEFESIGDRVCWLESVCPDCGALVEAELPAACWRCGSQVIRT
jgi:hypothetical protein